MSSFGLWFGHQLDGMILSCFATLMFSFFIFETNGDLDACNVQSSSKMYVPLGCT